MYDDLDRIERCYGSVAEYNRSMSETDPREFERMERQKANERILDENPSSSVYFAWECSGCRYYLPVGMTRNDDDIEHGLCCNHECERFKEEYENKREEYR